MSFQNRLTQSVVATSVSAWLFLASAVATPPDQSRIFSEDVGAVVNTTIQRMSAHEYDVAVNSLIAALSYPDVTPYERSTIY